MAHEWAPVDSIPQKTKHALLFLTAAFTSDASNTTDVLTVESGVDVELLTVSSCPVVDKEKDLILCKSKFKAFLVLADLLKLKRCNQLIQVLADLLKLKRCNPLIQVLTDCNLL
ncbi:hypothetical protein TNCV_421661 [Trichonephila clavipes]|nr:hypothetical protein TNCV_421661 [Trichonephila clavipes]